MEKEKKKKTLPSPLRLEGLLLFSSRGPAASQRSPAFLPTVAQQGRRPTPSWPSVAHRSPLLSLCQARPTRHHLLPELALSTVRLRSVPISVLAVPPKPNRPISSGCDRAAFLSRPSASICAAALALALRCRCVSDLTELVFTRRLPSPPR